jgi:deferrochelatase/peroxidase EfeB
VTGAPIQLSPTGDNLDLARNKNRNNNFLFANSNDKCPFVAHIRKTNPRDDLTNTPGRGGEPAHEDHSIIRRGIPF